MYLRMRQLQLRFHFPTILISTLLFVCPSLAQTSIDINRKLTSGQLIEDVNFYVQTIEETHINPYAHISQKEWRAQADSIKSRIAAQGAMTQHEFWLLFTPLVSAIQDKHTLVMEPRFFIANNPTKYLPVRTIYVDGNIVVTSSVADVKITKGAVITSINGIESDEVIRRLSKYRFGVGRERISDVGEWLWIGAAEVLGRPDSFALSFSDGTKADVKGLTVSEIINREKAISVNPPKTSDLPLELKLLDNNVAYLKASTFDHDLEKYKALLRDVFTRIKSAGVRSLIVDVRENDGGYSKLGDALIDMFSARPQKRFRMKWKKSAQYVERMKSQNDPIPDYYQALTPGQVYTSNPEIVKPGENPLRFNGQVYVLSGRKTFSSGLMFLGVVKDNKLATVIGEETNQPGCSAGESYPFNLPNSRLRVMSSTKYWIPPGGCNGTRGVVPDVSVKQGLEDYRLGRDAILSAALDLFKRKS